MWSWLWFNELCCLITGSMCQICNRFFFTVCNAALCKMALWWHVQKGHLTCECFVRNSWNCARPHTLSGGQTMRWFINYFYLHIFNLLCHHQKYIVLSRVITFLFRQHDHCFLKNCFLRLLLRHLEIKLGFYWFCMCVYCQDENVPTM